MRLAPLALVFAGLAISQPSRAQIAQSEYAARRAALAEHMADGGVLLLLGAPEPAEDFLSFYQSPTFEYLTGLHEPNAALVMTKRGATTSAILFVLPNDPSREVWTGKRLGPAGAARLTSLEARPVDQFRSVLDTLLASASTVYATGGTMASGGVATTPEQRLIQSIRAAQPTITISDIGPVVRQLRGRKSVEEQALIRRAAEITVAAQREAMRFIAPNENEFEVQALIEYTFRRNGADRPSFATIVGSGPNSTTLHYNADDRFMHAGEVVVMDIGASYRGYAADVTRTVPVNGTFSPDQRAIYQLVRDGQAAGERQATLGARARLMSDSASAVLAAGLARLGLIESPTATYDCALDGTQCPQLGLYYMHALGHGIGLDVHDPDQFYFTGIIQRGSAFTIEPGIYVRANLLDILPKTPRNQALITKIAPAVRRYADIGVRIEDDYVATEHGVEWISRAPREIAEVEAAMKLPYRGPAPRDSGTVEAYRKGR
jgi:Xaa-Pro aminopeptidase